MSKQIKDSASIAFAILASAETILAISGISLNHLIPNQKWWGLLFTVLLMYAAFFAIVYIILKVISARGIKIKINGINVEIKRGDLFTSNGWKVIPFNEYFDTEVDDIVISRTSLNGLFILNYVNDLDGLIRTIADDAERNTTKTGNNCKRKFPLGHCIAYQREYILLAFAHFDEQNVAHINRVDYEYCLMNMWKEIRRLYANKPVFLPLIGSGITSFDDIPHKSNFDLLKCMLCTLKASSENLNQPMTIVLTKGMMQEINLYELKGVI